ncbi:5-oxoprolinase subunit PxpA [Luteolibacter yonseiensis]
MRWIDLNADLGEGGSEDEALIGLVSSANIACGGHAGDEETMRRSIRWAKEAGVAIGAHPGYKDPEHFGRRAMVLPLENITELVAEQVGKLAALAAEEGAELHHVKPHGALYHQAGRDAALAAAVVEGILKVSPGLILFAQPGSELAQAAERAGVKICTEGFADRRYRDDGTLMPRGEPGAVIKEVNEAVEQAMALVSEGRMQTLCIHGDGTTAAGILSELRRTLEAAGVTVRPAVR